MEFFCRQLRNVSSDAKAYEQLYLVLAFGEISHINDTSCLVEDVGRMYWVPFLCFQWKPPVHLDVRGYVKT